MPKITDNDDVNLDDIDTEVVGDDTEQPAGDDGADDDLPADEGDDLPDDSEGDEPDDDAGTGADEIAARRQRQEQDGTRRGGRENARVRALNEQLRLEREERLSLQRRFDEFATRQNQPAAPRGESEAERNARRATLSETERLSEDMREMREAFTTSTRNTQMAVHDTTDKSLYEAKAINDPLYRKYQSKVDAELTRIRQNGGNVPREAVLRYLLGTAVLESRGSKDNKTRKATGERRLRRETTRPNDTRNDATQARRGGGRNLEDRLANVQL